MTEALYLPHLARLDVFFKFPENGKIITFRRGTPQSRTWAGPPVS
jgi:hypothetical protein